jgi:hypothetical protein
MDKLGLIALTVAGTVACTAGTPDTGEPPVEDACPEGFHQATAASMVFTQVNVDNIDYFLGFDANAALTPPAACINDAGTAATWRAISGTEPFASFTIQTTGTGSFTLIDGTFDLSVEVTGRDEPFTFGPEDWTMGGALVDAVGSRLAWSVNGSAVADGRQGTFVLSAEARP